jgi:hypothetical protein
MVKQNTPSSYYSPFLNAKVCTHDKRRAAQKSERSDCTCNTLASNILQNTEFKVGASPHEIFTRLKRYAVPLTAQDSILIF